MIAYVICDLMIASRMYVFAFGVPSRILFLGVALAIVGVFTVVNFIDRDYVPVCVVISLVLYMLVQHFAFSQRTGLDFNVNVLAQCYGFLGFNIFYALARRDAIGQALRFVLGASAIYLVVYCVMAVLFYLGLIDDLTSTEVYTVLTDLERGNRLFLSTGHVTFVLMFSLAYIVRKFRMTVFLTLCLAIAAILLSIARVLIATDFLVAILFVFIRRFWVLSRVVFAIYLALVIYLSWGVFFPEFNPFDFSSTDSSTIYRRNEFTVMSELLRQHPIFGVGLYDNVETLAYVTGRALQFPSDIGFVGMCFVFGFTGGLLLGILPAFICCFQRLSRGTAQLTDAQRSGLMLVGYSLAIYSATAMTIFNGADGVIFAIVFGVWLYDVSAESVSARGLYRGEQSARIPIGSTRSN